MSLTVSNVSVREWLHGARERVQPWGDFVDTKRFKMPSNVAPLPRQILANMKHFQGNYLFIFLGFVLFCIITSPGLLLAMAVCGGACYFVSSRNSTGQPLTIKGVQIPITQQYAAVAGLSFPLFWLAGAGAAVFWIIGASFFVIMLHATTYTPVEGGDSYDLEMDSIQTLP